MNPVEDALVKRLDLIAELDDEDRKALKALPATLRSVEAGSDIVEEGQRIRDCCLLLSGFTHRYRTLIEGKRQIIAFHVPGDIPDLHSLHINVMDHSFAATVNCELAFIPHEAIWQLCQERPAVAAALWRETLIDGSIFREWIVGLGRRTGLQRTAHLLCEMAMRLRAMGHGDGLRYHLPLTQNVLADALGLTVVTVNRVLQELRQADYVVRDRSRMTIHNWPALARLAEFDGGYLHMRRPPNMSVEMRPEDALK